MVIEIKPLEGIFFDSKAILLGENKNGLEEKLGIPEIIRKSFYYFNRELRFDFSLEGEIEFIEFLGGKEGSIQPVIYGVPAFQINAKELYDILAGHACGKILDNENGHSYCFCDIGIGIYRESTPKETHELIQEMKKLGIDPDINVDAKREHEDSNHWATIGLGSATYY